MELTGVVWISLVFVIGPCAAGLSDEHLLTKSILAQLDRNLSHLTRPNVGSSPVQVDMTVDLLEVRDLDKKSDVAELYVEEQYMWYEPRVQWEPSEFSSISRLRLPARAVWRPDVFMTNDQSMNPDALIGRVMVTWDGRVTWSPRVIHRTKCSQAMSQGRRSRSPEWQCYLDYACKDYTEEEVNLMHAGNTGLDTSRTMESSDWEVKRSGVKKTGGEVSYTLTLNEKPYVRRVVNGEF